MGSTYLPFSMIMDLPCYDWLDNHMDKSNERKEI